MNQRFTSRIFPDFNERFASRRNTPGGKMKTRWSFNPKPRDRNQRIPPLGVSLVETLSSKRAESTIPCSLTCLVASKALSGISNNGAKSIYLSWMVFLLYQTIEWDREREKGNHVHGTLIDSLSKPPARPAVVSLLCAMVKKKTDSELLVGVFYREEPAQLRSGNFAGSWISITSILAAAALLDTRRTN